MKKIRIGTRGSKLALMQANMVADALRECHPGLETEIVEILTAGDWQPAHGETRLAEAEGGKGLFAREIERALLAGTIDCGVHSMKDMPSFLPEGLVIEHMLPRADPRDALLANGDCGALVDLPQGATVGTASLRRQAFLLQKRPDLKIVPLRGNVPTRIEKLRSGQVDATILALSGLKRLGLTDEIAAVLEPEDMLPAAGQGAIGIEFREQDDDLRAVLDAVHCEKTGLCVAAERAALQVLDGSCHTPIGAFAELEGQNLALRVVVASGDGAQSYEEEASETVTNRDEAVEVGRMIGKSLKSLVPPELLAA